MAIKKDLIPSILNKVRTTYQNSINDNSGLFRQGKFTPIKQVSEIKTPTGTLGQNIKQVFSGGINKAFNPYARIAENKQNNAFLRGGADIVNQGLKSYVNWGTLGLVQPKMGEQQTKWGTIGKIGGGIAGFTGGIGGKVMAGIDKIGQAGITKFAPTLQRTLLGKAVGGLGKEAAQTATYVGGKYLSGKVGLRPEEKITGKSVLQDLALGAAMRGITTPGIGGMVKKAISPDVWTSDRNTLNEALQRLKVGETIDEFSETGKAIKNMYKEYGLASYPNWNKLSQSQQVQILSERLDEMARSGFGVKVGITDQPIKTGTSIKNFDDVSTSASKYGWTTKPNANGEIELTNRLGKLVVTLKQKPDGSYVYIDSYGNKVMSGRGQAGISTEKLIRDFYYGKLEPVTQPIKTGEVSPLSPESVSPIKRGGDVTDVIDNPLYKEVSTAKSKLMDKINSIQGKYKTDAEIPKPILDEINKLNNDYDAKFNKWNEWTKTVNQSQISPESKGIKPALIDKKIDLGVSPKAEKIVQPDLKLSEVPIEKTQISTPETLQSAQTAPLDSQDIIPKERGFVTTVKESEITAPEVKAGIEGFYEPITNKETIAKAKKVVSSGWDLAKERVMGKEYNADVVAIGEELARVAQKEGRTDEAIEILETLSRKATDAGQGIQALSIWKRLTPEGMLKFAEKELKKSEENAGFLTKLFKKGDTKISQEGKRFILDEMSKVQKMADGEEKNKIIQSVLNRINDEIPIGASELFDAYRYQNLLSSPRTQLRNAYQNAYQALINKPATLASEATVDWIGSTLKGTERTKYFSDVPTYYKGLWNSRIDANNAFMDVWKGKDEFTNLDIQQLRAKNLPKKLTVVSRLMEGADKYFQSLIGGGEYAKLMKNGATEEVAKKGAKEAAEYYLLRNLPDPKNKTGQGLVLTAIDNATVGVTELGRRIPALRWFVPFIRTPMNAAKQWIEYSPAGVLTTIGAKNKSSQLAKAMIGSVVTGIGASLALQDRTTWSAPTDAKEKEFFYASGKKPYSIKIGDKWVPMVYLGPHALALAIPAAFKQYQTDSKTALTDTQLEKATKSITSLLGFFSEQTFLTGMGNFVRAISGDADYTFAGNIAGAAGQVIPLSSLQRYVAQIVDPVFRKTSGGKGLTGQFMNQMKSQIPFLTKTLEPYTLPNGELSKRNITDYVAPYSMGIQKDEYEPYLESRKAKLQQNAVINKAKKDLETTGGTQEIDGKILYTKDGEVKTLDLGKVSRLPEQTAYQRALKQKEAYKIVDDVLDNLEGDQQINALKALGITSADATYYNTARQENYLKSIYVEEEIRNMIGQGQTKDQILNTLASMRRAVNEKILLSDGVINDLVDKNIISYQDGKALKNLGKDLKPKKLTTGKAKKAKKITLTKPKVTPIKETFKEVKYPTTRAKTTAQLPKYVKPNFTTSFKLL